jgi:hypothetical protein
LHIVIMPHPIATTLDRPGRARLEDEDGYEPTHTTHREVAWRN